MSLSTDSSPLRDEELLVLIQKDGSHAAFSHLVTRHAQRFRALAYRYTNSAPEAEDIVQDCFLRLWSDPSIWDGSRGVKFTTWFYRLVVNRCLDQIRKRRTRPFGEDEEFQDDALAADDDLAQKQMIATVETAMRTLPDTMQTALNLGYTEDVPQSEAADIMQISLSAYKSLLLRAKLQLRDKVNALLRPAADTKRRANYGT